MSAIKIIENLYLGDQFSAPQNTEIIVNCAEELFPQKIGEYQEFKQINKTYYFNFQDMPSKVRDINPELVSQCLQTIDEQLKMNKKVYVHCLWGVNRSASMVFMYLVKNKYLEADNLEDMIKEFRTNYPRFSPNPSYDEFIKQNFPFKNL